MVQESIVEFRCEHCMTEWSIEPEPHYRTWEDMGHDEPKEVEEDFVACPFCGSESVTKL